MCIPLPPPRGRRGILFLSLPDTLLVLSHTLMSKSFIAPLFLLTLATPAFAQIAPAEPVACTMDAFLCPDGSYVGRTGPQCEFVCPPTQTNETNGTSTATSTAGTRDTRDTTLLPATNRPGQDGARAENQAARQAIREERNSALTAVRQQRITNLAANISNRLEAAITRLFSIINRLDTRILTMKQRGIDTATAETALQRASLSLAEAQNLMRDIDILVYEATTSEQPYTAWQPLMERYRTVANLIRSTHSELRTVIASLKSAAQATTTTGASDAVQNESSQVPLPL